MPANQKKIITSVSSLKVQRKNRENRFKPTLNGGLEVKTFHWAVEDLGKQILHLVTFYPDNIQLKLFWFHEGLEEEPS